MSCPSLRRGEVSIAAGIIVAVLIISPEVVVAGAEEIWIEGESARSSAVTRHSWTEARPRGEGKGVFRITLPAEAMYVILESG